VPECPELPPSPNLKLVLPSRSTVIAIAVVVALVGLVLAWTLTPLHRILEPGAVLAYRDRIRALPFAPLAAIAVFVVGGFVSAPATLMIGAAVLVFGPLSGPLYAMTGLLASASATCVTVRYLVRDFVDEWLATRRGSRVEAFSRALERHGFLAIILMRLTPTPFMFQNLIAGVSRVSLVHIFFGTAIGVIPVITVMTGVTMQFDAWLAQPDWTRLSLLIGTAVAMVAIFWLLRRWAERRGGNR
jgi:phospholipase D1/2